jgi:hypothetical protein
MSSTVHSSSQGALLLNQSADQQLTLTAASATQLLESEVRAFDSKLISQQNSALGQQQLELEPVRTDANPEETFSDAELQKACALIEKLTSEGTPDPRLNPLRKVVGRLSNQLATKVSLLFNINGYSLQEI